MGLFGRKLTEERVKTLVGNARDLGDDGDQDGAWKAAKALVAAQRGDADIALALGFLLERGTFGVERGVALAAELVDAHPENPHVLGAVGAASEELSDRRYLNAEPPSDAAFVSALQRLLTLETRYRDTDEEWDVLRGLSSVARILGRSYDEVTERTQRRRIELNPDRWQDHYDLGLFYKTRGRFEEGVAANRRARELGGEDDNGVLWNLGICATGAGDGGAALEAWRGIGLELELGRLGLPEGGFAATKVRLAQWPLAERSADEPQEPGLEESVWIERLSPCHGVIRSALYYDDLGVDYGDIILFDGAPILHQTYGESQIPVFPHLATLSRPGYGVFHFAGTQNEEREVGNLSKQLPDDAVIYVHTEQFHNMCRACWENPELDHADHETEEHGIVTGKVCAPPSMTAAEFRAELDRVLEGTPTVRLFVPELTRAAGDDKRADVEARRMGMLVDSGDID